MAAPSTPSQTAWAVLALLAGGDTTSTSLLDGMDYLLRNANERRNVGRRTGHGDGIPESLLSPLSPLPAFLPADGAELFSAGEGDGEGLRRVKPVLVTGATGFVGWHVARVLRERGYPVRALVRGGKRVRELDVEHRTGDLRDAESLAGAVQGCGAVFHVAADYRLWARDAGEMRRSNVEGTRNVLWAARRAGVERVVYTSTVGCIGIPAGGEGDEERPVALGDMAGAYKRSKFEAEMAALEFARNGLPVVIVNPTAPVGDGDVKPTPTGGSCWIFCGARCRRTSIRA